MALFCSIDSQMCLFISLFLSLSTRPSLSMSFKLCFCPDCSVPLPVHMCVSFSLSSVAVLECLSLSPSAHLCCSDSLWPPLTPSLWHHLSVGVSVWLPMSLSLSLSLCFSYFDCSESRRAYVFVCISITCLSLCLATWVLDLPYCYASLSTCVSFFECPSLYASLSQLFSFSQSSWLCVSMCFFLSLCVWPPLFVSVALPLCVSLSLHVPVFVCHSLCPFCSVWVSLWMPPLLCVWVHVCVCLSASV